MAASSPRSSISACGFAGCFTDDGTERRAATLTLTTHYVAPPEHGPLKAVATVRGGGRRTFFASADVTDATGALVAIGEASFRYRSGA